MSKKKEQSETTPSLSHGTTNANQKLKHSLGSDSTSREEGVRINEGNEALFTKEQVENTPFWIIGDEKQGYVVAMGKHQLTEPEETVDKARALIRPNNWLFQLGLIGAIVEIAQSHEYKEIKDAIKASENMEQVRQKN